MPIQVTCPKCLTRFAVAEKYAGKEGPCPKCKGKITIPKLEDELVIHAPVGDAPKDAKGRSVLKTAKRKDTKFQPLVAAGLAGAALLILLGALVLRFSPALQQSPAVLLAFAAIVGPLSAWGGYTFLRDAELEPFVGKELWIRCAVCGIAYAALWGVYCLIAGQINPEWQVPGKGLEIWQVLVPAAAAIGIGTLAAFASLDLEPAVGLLHCLMFFVITVGLRFVAGLPALPGFLMGT